MYFKDFANTFPDLLSFENVNPLTFEQSTQKTTSTRIVILVKDLVIFVTADCFKESCLNRRQTMILLSCLTNIKSDYPINIVVKFPKKHLLRITKKNQPHDVLVQELGRRSGDLHLQYSLDQDVNKAGFSKHGVWSERRVFGKIGQGKTIAANTAQYMLTPAKINQMFNAQNFIVQ